MWAALLAFSLAGAPQVADPLAAPLAELRAEKTPSVESVRAALKALRALESAARPLLARHTDDARVHRALAEGWSAAEKLETRLQIDGQGDGPEREAIRAMADARSQDAHAIAASELAPGRGDAREALRACWQEHLLSMDGPDSLDAVATLSLERGQVISVEFAPELVGPRVRLRECLQTRLLGWGVTGDADAVELPLHFTAPGSEAATKHAPSR